MNRRQALRLGAASILPLPMSRTLQAGPDMPAWPDDAEWADLGQLVGDRLQKVEWPIQACLEAPWSEETAAFFRSAKNPYVLGDHPGLTQTFGWADAWYAKPSAYVVIAEMDADIVEAVRFAARHRVRLVVKGGGHSYHGASNAPDSLLVWTRHMNRISLHDHFTPTGCEGFADPVPAVTVEAGAIWGEVYQEVTTRGGRYVQGGGCLTVGVAGLVQGGGFGSFSKAYGLAAASLLQAEIVTADGELRTVNACREPDLFFALKGGGGGTFGIVTRLTLQTHELPTTFGAFFAEIRAASDADFRDLVREMIAFYAQDLFNPHWGEQLSFRPDNTLAIAMVFQGLTDAEVSRIWRPFVDRLEARPEAFQLSAEPIVLAVPARSFWDPGFLRSLPGIVFSDDRPGVSRDRIFWAGNREEAGQIIHAYQSAWVPADLLREDRQDELVEALHAASRHWGVTLHTNKGLAGAPPKVLEAARGTAVNPAAMDAFALAISGAEGPTGYPGIAGYEPDLAAARSQATRVGQAMEALRSYARADGAYLYESDYFQQDWQRAYWGPHHPRLLATKRHYDPESLFQGHHVIGMEV